MNMIRKRIYEINELNNNINFFEKNLYLTFKKNLFDFFNITKGRIDWGSLINEKTINIEELTRNEIQDILSKILQKDKVINILWISDNIACEIESILFIKYFDDLWYPAADDIIVTATTFKWIIEINHEEIIRYGKVIHS